MRSPFQKPGAHRRYPPPATWLDQLTLFVRVLVYGGFLIGLFVTSSTYVTLCPCH